MTTDTALALLAEAEDAICILSDSIRDRTVSEYYSNLCDRITALLDSGIKDAGDDVVEPYVWEVCGEKWIRKEGYDTLLSAYKRACVERDEAITRAADQVNTDTVSVPKECEWWLSDEFEGDTWDGQCGAKWTFTEAGPDENDMHYCPSCGGKLIIRAAQEGKK
jgi:hypothetical protein